MHANNKLGQSELITILRRAKEKAFIAKNHDMLTGVNYCIEEIATALKLEGLERKAFFEALTAPKVR